MSSDARVAVILGGPPVVLAGAPQVRLLQVQAGSIRKAT